MNNQNQVVVSSKTQRSLDEKIIMQLMAFNKCTYERATYMYKEMLQTIADYYLIESVSSKTQNGGNLTQNEVEKFAVDVVKSYGLIENHVKELKLC